MGVFEVVVVCAVFCCVYSSPRWFKFSNQLSPYPCMGSRGVWEPELVVVVFMVDVVLVLEAELVQVSDGID